MNDIINNDRPELLEALEGILGIGKRNMSNPKYDGYFDEARQAIAKAKGMDEKIKCSEYCENEATKESHCCPHQYETYSNDCDSFCNCCDDCKHDCEMDN